MARDPVHVGDHDAENDERNDDAGQNNRMIDHGCAPWFTAAMLMVWRARRL